MSAEVGSRIKIERSYIERLRRGAAESGDLVFLEHDISRTFSSPSTAFSDARLSVELADRLPSNGKRFSFTRTDEFRVAVQYGEETVELELCATHAINRRSAVNLMLNVVFPDVPKPFVLSAERFGIALFYKELDFTKSRLVEMLQQIDDQNVQPRHTPLVIVDRIASRYAVPVKHNVDFTRNIENILHQDSEFVGDKLHEEVRNLMSGYYASADGVIRFKSTARKRRAFDIPLHIASSSARGLSDLYFYLRHVASRNDILFIDEPETHLDTANQVMLARVISRLVAAGLKVLVSTHSDYLIKEINNLVMLDHLHSKGDLGRELGYGADEGIPSERIRAYVAEQNTLKRCVVDRYGIDAPVFDETIDRINRVSTKLASAVADTE